MLHIKYGTAPNTSKIRFVDLVCENGMHHDKMRDQNQKYSLIFILIFFSVTKNTCSVPVCLVETE